MERNNVFGDTNAGKKLPEQLNSDTSIFNLEGRDHLMDTYEIGQEEQNLLSDSYDVTKTIQTNNRSNLGERGSENIYRKNNSGNGSGKNKNKDSLLIVVGISIGVIFATIISMMVIILFDDRTPIGSTVSQTPTPALTSTPTPTFTPTPTPTPTATPTPTPTVTPTATPLPTPTPTEIPEPIEPSGNMITIFGGIQAPVSDFIFPESSSSYLSYERMNQMLESSDADRMHSLSQLAIDEIFARYGYTFTSSSVIPEEANARFGGKEWYQQAQKICPVGIDEWDVLVERYYNDFEKANFYALNEWQKDHNVYY